MSLRLGEILVSEGACTGEDVRNALKNQVIFGGRLGTNLLEIQAVTEDALARALGKQHALPSLCGELELDPSATALVTAEVADRYDVIPYVLAERRLAMLVVDPKDLAMLDEVAFATGKSIHPIVVPEARIWALLRTTYGIDRHLRGIDVGFGKIRREEAAKAAADGAAPRKGGADLMGEAEFDALYSARTAPPAAATPPAAAAPAGVPQAAAPPATAPPPSPSAPAPAPAQAAAAPAPPAATPPPLAAPDDVVELTDLLEAEPWVTPRTAAAIPPPAPHAATPATAAEVLAALASGPGHAPPARPVARAPRQEEPEPSPLSFDEAVRFLEGVEERDAIARTVLRYARSKFRRAVLLTVQGGAARGWAGLGEKLGSSAVRRIQLDLAAPGVVATVARTRSHFLGPIPKTDANIRLLKLLGGGVPGNALLVPILALGRVVNVFYADAGKGAMVDASGVGELLILATRISKSYETLVERV